MGERDVTERLGPQPHPHSLLVSTNSGFTGEHVPRVTAPSVSQRTGPEAPQTSELPRPLSSPTPSCQVWLAGKTEVKPGLTPISSSGKQKGSGSYASTIYKDNQTGLTRMGDDGDGARMRRRGRVWGGGSNTVMRGWGQDGSDTFMCSRGSKSTSLKYNRHEMNCKVQ